MKPTIALFVADPYCSVQSTNGIITALGNDYRFKLFSKNEVDFFLSRKYSPRKFRIIRHHFGQDSRRFKKMGYMGMAKYLVKNFVNRNNQAYWDKLDSSRYWS
jgi:hypothetical protein